MNGVNHIWAEWDLLQHPQKNKSGLESACGPFKDIKGIFSFPNGRSLPLAPSELLIIYTSEYQSKEVFTTLYENLEHLESYLVMEKLRFDDSFTYRVIVDECIDKEETLIPTLMIQPLVENAIWH